MNRAALVLALVAAAGVFALAQTPSVIPGQWTLDVSKSTYTPGPAPRSQHAVLTAIPNGIRTVSDRVEADGTMIHFEWNGTFDGKDQPVIGDPARDAVSVRKIDEYTIEVTNKKAGKVTTVLHAEYARDGKSRTETTTGTNAQGQAVKNVTYWTKDAESSYVVTLVPPKNGKVQLTPALPADGKYRTGTVVTVTTTADPGYALDSAWYSVRGRFGQMYHEGMTREFKVTIDQDKRIGASFVPEAMVKDLTVTYDVVYATPGKKALKYDVFSPKGARGLPVIVIVHGGGWTANDEDIMRGLARELTKGGHFVVASMDYRWAGREDGDATSNTMANLIEDVFGGIAHIMEHAAQYGGDPARIGLTGDSAGGHLVAAASLMPNMIGSRGFGKTPGVFEFMPTYVPKGKTVDQIREELMKAIKAAAPSYGVFSAAQLDTYSDDHASDQAWKDAIAPLNHIPPAAERAVPQFLTRGTNDRLISDASVKEFVDALVKAGQRAEYIQVGGAGHAFFDWKPDDNTKATFAKYGVYYAQRMRTFFESVLSKD